MRDTYGRLKCIGLSLLDLGQKGARIDSFRSWEHVLDHMREKRVLNETEVHDPVFRVDAWGRPFRWVVEESNEEIVARVISYGPNGVPEGGRGDDMYVELRVPEHGKPRLLFKPPKVRLPSDARE